MTRTRNAVERKNGAFPEMAEEASCKRHGDSHGKLHVLWVFGDINDPMISDDC